VSVTPPASPRRNSRVEVDMDLDEEASQSVSITPATVNQRAASRAGLPSPSRLAAPDEEDDYFPTDSGMSTVEHTDPTPTLRPDPDDDESTVGYSGYAGDPDSEAYATEAYANTHANLPRRRLPAALLVAGGGALLLALGAGLLWALSPVAMSPATPRDLSDEVVKQQQAAPTPSAADDATAHAGTPTPDGESPPRAALEDAGTAVAETDTPAAVAPVADVAPADAGTPAPVLVAVRFEAPSRTVLRQEGGKPLPINKVVSLPPGPIRVRYDCPGRRTPKGTKPYLVEPAGEGPLVLQIPCKSRR
jgi:hypothetical protein